jgi:hypothetical protein
MCPLPCFGRIEIRNLSYTKISLTSQPEKQEWEIVTYHTVLGDYRGRYKDYTVGEIVCRGCESACRGRESH